MYTFTNIKEIDDDGDDYYYYDNDDDNENRDVEYDDYEDTDDDADKVQLITTKYSIATCTPTTTRTSFVSS